MNASLINAFPAKLHPDVCRLASLLDPRSGVDTSEPFGVVVDGEALQIPCRFYGPVITEGHFKSLHEREQLIAACWLTRHHNGHVRERFLRALPAFDFAWIIAYVVTLCGEYVIEILDCIWERRGLFDSATLGRWLSENPDFYALTRSRIVSYWNCYYRSKFPYFDDYVGGLLLSFFDISIANTQSTGGV